MFLTLLPSKHSAPCLGGPLQQQQRREEDTMQEASAAGKCKTDDAAQEQQISDRISMHTSAFQPRIFTCPRGVPAQKVAQSVHWLGWDILRKEKPVSKGPLFSFHSSVSKNIVHFPFRLSSSQDRHLRIFLCQPRLLILPHKQIAQHLASANSLP